MKTLQLLVILSFLSASIYGQKADPKQAVQQKMQQVITGGKCVGIAAGAVTNGSKTWYHEEGYMDLETKKPFTHVTISRTASITKPMTAIAIMQLVEQGKVALDAPVSTYIPYFKKEPLSAITVKHVLQHSSGIRQYKNKKEAMNETEYPGLEDAMRKFIDSDLLFEPGSNFSYTSYGYVVLGIVIEKASGMSYEEYMQQNIFEPAQMKNTSIERSGITYLRKSSMYHTNKPGKFKKITRHNLSDRIPGGGVQSTVEDLLKFGNAVLEHKLITESSLQLMITNYGLKKTGNGYGLGWYLYGKNSRYGNLIGHSGTQLGCSSFLFILPEVKTVTVVLANTSEVPETFVIALGLFDVAAELRNN